MVLLRRAVKFVALMGILGLAPLEVALGAQPAERSVSILVVYHSDTGNTKKMATAICRGVDRVEQASCRLVDVESVDEQALETMDGLILGGPVHWANLSVKTKEFIDLLGAQLFEARRIGPEKTPASDDDYRTAGVFVTGGSIASGKEVVRLGLVAAFMNMRFVVVGGEDDEGFGTFGAQATTGPDDPGVEEEELSEASSYGERFARVTLRLRR